MHSPLLAPVIALVLWSLVMCAWLFDIALSGILNAARYDLGFYAGRIYGLCAASFVLAALLVVGLIVVKPKQYQATATVAGLGDCVAGVSAFAASSCVLDSAFIGGISPGSLCVHFVQLCFLRKFCSRIAFRMQETENGGNENQGGHRCEEQAADDGAA